MKQPEIVSKQLPFDARMALVRAAATPVDKDPLARKKAIDAAMERIKARFPRLFTDQGG